MKLFHLATLAGFVFSATAALIEPRLFNAPRFPRPSIDPFYALPSGLEALAKGAIIRERSVPSTVGLLARNVTQVLYRTETSDGRPDATVATLYTPLKIAPGPPKILVILLPQDSAAVDCDLNWAQVPYSGSQGTQIIVTLNSPPFYAAMRQGWYVVTPGHEGSQAAFIAGPGAGKASIDGLRAMLNHKPTLPSTAGYKASFYGYSGGGAAAAWANQMASTAYGRDLNILGAAYGGTIAYLRPVVDFLNKGFFAGFAGAGIAGLANAYPELNEYLNSILLPNGKAAIAKLRKGDGCTLGALTSFAFADFYSFVSVSNVLDEPIPKKYLELNSLGKTVLRKPAYIYHERDDEVVQFAQIESYVKDQCTRGAKISFHVAEIGEHFTGLLTGLEGAFAWLIKLMDGSLPALTECETVRAPFFGGVASPQALKTLGPEAVAAALALNGTMIAGRAIKL